MTFTDKEMNAWIERTPAGERFKTANERASEGDRQWFKDHPRRTLRVRPALESEAPALMGPGVFLVSVTCLKDGVRMRGFIRTDLPTTASRKAVKAAAMAIEAEILSATHQVKTVRKGGGKPC